MHEFWKNSRFTYNLNSISRVTILKGVHALTNPQIQWVTFSYRVPCVATKVRFSPVIFFDFKRSKFCHRCPNSVIGTWTISTASSNHDHRTAPFSATPEADLISTLQVTAAWSPKPSVVWYCPPYRTLHFPRHNHWTKLNRFWSHHCWSFWSGTSSRLDSSLLFPIEECVQSHHCAWS